VAQSRKRKKHHWLRTVLLFVMTPFVIWFAAFVIWFFWYDITGLVKSEKRYPPLNATSPQDLAPEKERNAQPAKRPRESIPEEDRKKLDDIIKRR
jgi:hypothetical protein